MEVVILFSVTFERKTVRPKNILEPRMAKKFRQRYPVLGLYHEHSCYQVFSLLRNWNRKLDIHSELTLVEALHSLGSKRHGALEHNVQEDSQGPYVYVKARVFAVARHLWGQVGGSSALLLNKLISSNELANSEITDLYSALSIQKNIVKLNISMKNRSAVAMSHTLRDLFENIFGLILSKFLALLYKMVEITSASILHNHHDVFFILEHFIKSNNI